MTERPLIVLGTLTPHELAQIRACLGREVEHRTEVTAAGITRDGERREPDQWLVASHDGPGGTFASEAEAQACYDDLCAASVAESAIDGDPLAWVRLARVVTLTVSKIP